MYCSPPSETDTRSRLSPDLSGTSRKAPLEVPVERERDPLGDGEPAVGLDLHLDVGGRERELPSRPRPAR